jgi:hypothetical protein
VGIAGGGHGGGELLQCLGGGVGVGLDGQGLVGELQSRARVDVEASEAVDEPVADFRGEG